MHNQRADHFFIAYARRTNTHPCAPYPVKTVTNQLSVINLFMLLFSAPNFKCTHPVVCYDIMRQKPNNLIINVNMMQKNLCSDRTHMEKKRQVNTCQKHK